MLTPTCKFILELKVFVPTDSSSMTAAEAIRRIDSGYRASIQSKEGKALQKASDNLAVAGLIVQDLVNPIPAIDTEPYTPEGN